MDTGGIRNVNRRFSNNGAILGISIHGWMIGLVIMRCTYYSLSESTPVEKHTRVSYYLLLIAE